MAHITAKGIDINYELTGDPDAPVITLSHSLATDLSMWDPQTAELRARFRVLRYDTRGHGGTTVPPGPYSLEQLAEDARALLDALAIDRTHFVGISMGGMIGQTLALTHPEILESLVLCDTTASLPPEAGPIWAGRMEAARVGGMQRHVETTVGRWFTPGFISANPDTVDRVRAMIRDTPVEGYIGCAEAIKRLDLLGRLATITTPTLVVVGADDPGTPPAAARAIQERIPGAELAVIESASHLCNIEQPEAFNRTLLGFLERLTPDD
ncbi:MAG: 3-oxoadipate enol-lactonase [Thermoleophilia bacterium]